MAFTKADVVRFEKHRTPPPESLVDSVFVAVNIHDDTTEETKYAEFFCVGDDLAALQAITDPAEKAAASKAWLAAKVAEAHAQWAEELVTPKPTVEAYDGDMLLAEFGATEI